MGIMDYLFGCNRKATPSKEEGEVPAAEVIPGEVVEGIYKSVPRDHRIVIRTLANSVSINSKTYEAGSDVAFVQRLTWSPWWDEAWGEYRHNYLWQDVGIFEPAVESEKNS
jgi:hypothetical protein